MHIKVKMKHLLLISLFTLAYAPFVEAKSDAVIKSLPLNKNIKTIASSTPKKENVEKWITGLGGLQESVVTKKSYLKGILNGTRYGKYTVTKLLAARDVRDFYRKRAYQTVWISSDFKINPMLFEMLSFVRDISSEGLESSKYHLAVIEAILDEIKMDDFPSRRNRNLAVATVDILLSDAFLALAKDLREGLIDFEKFEYLLHENNELEEKNANWENPRRRIKYVKFFENVVKSGALKESFNALTSHNEMYILLKEAYLRYQEIERAGGWKKIPYGNGRRLKLGSISKKRVPILAKRLSITGDLDPSYINTTKITPAIKEALKRYQTRMGLWASGSLTESTRRALNVSVKKILQKLKLNMERARWEKKPFGDEYIWINIPEYKMKFIRYGQEEVDMKVVVGKPKNPTPIFTSKFSYVVLNPSWTVPSSIVKKEMLSRIQEDPDYLESHRFKLFSNRQKTKEIDGFNVDWWQFDEESKIPFSFVREAGAGNPLGTVKFMFPNKYAVYMHDTPDKYLFKNTKRAYSHGCIRLHKPQEFLAFVKENYLLNPVEKDKKNPLQEKSELLTLDRSIPVYIRYYTTWVDKDGLVNFRPDVYGYDRMQEGFIK